MTKHYPAAIQPAIGKAALLESGEVLVKLSTARRTQAPGSVIAQARAAEVLGVKVAYKLSARIVAQAVDARWMLWSVTA